MGYRDSVDPATEMEIESSSFISSASDADSTPQLISSGAKERKESAASARKTRTDLQQVLTWNAGGCKEVRGKESRKKKRAKGDEANGTDDLSAYMEMWEKYLQQENDRFEKSMKMFQENQKMQMRQTVSPLSGFKDLMKDLMKE